VGVEAEERDKEVKREKCEKQRWDSLPILMLFPTRTDNN